MLDGNAIITIVNLARNEQISEAARRSSGLISIDHPGRGWRAFVERRLRADSIAACFRLVMGLITLFVYDDDADEGGELRR